MNANKERLFGIAIMAAGLLLATINSIAATSMQISDSDPTTYIIVVMLMLFPFLFFYAKDRKLHLHTGKKEAAISIALLIIYIVVTSYLRVSMSYLFMSLRVDMLALPLVLLALAIAVFGIEGANEMKYIIIYSIFASPVIMLAISGHGISSALAYANAYAIYGMMHLMGSTVAIKGASIIAPSGESVSIASSCVAIGITAALVMFMVPLAEFYEGKKAGKAAWIAFGVVLLALFNLARMAVIAIAWNYYGIGSALALFHMVAGPILFYIAIIAMVAIAGKFGLRVPSLNGAASRKSKENPNANAYALALALCLVIGLAAFAFSLPYVNSINVSAYAFGNESIAWNKAGIAFLSALENSRENVTALGEFNGGFEFAIGSGKNASNMTYVLAFPIYKLAEERPSMENTTLIEGSALLLRNGITIHTMIVNQNSKEFKVSYFAYPAEINGSKVSMNYEFIRLIGSNGNENGFAINNGFISNLQSAFYNLVNGNSRLIPIKEAYYVAESIKG